MFWGNKPTFRDQYDRPIKVRSLREAQVIAWHRKRPWWARTRPCFVRDAEGRRHFYVKADKGVLGVTGMERR